MVVASNVIQLKQQRKKRRALTNQQRNILQAERSGKRAVAARYRARTASEQDIAGARYQANVAETREKEGIRTRAGYKRQVGRSAISSAGSNPVLHSTILIVVTMAILIVFYLTVTSATAFEGFLGSLQNGLRKLSTTSPLFERT